MKLADIDALDFDKGGGLLPAMVQHATTGAALMLGYMSREAVRATLERGRVVFFSRSRQRLWEKGETSGHFLELRELHADCDCDALLVSAVPHGPVCHTGARTCFGSAAPTAAQQLAFLMELESVIEQRITAATTDSYTAHLIAQGPRRIAQKVGEEGLEVALAAVAQSDGEVLAESADLLFHLLVLLRSRGLSLAAVVAELRSRHAPQASAS